MTINEFKEKLKKYLLEIIDTGYSIEDVDDEVLTELFYEYLYQFDDIVDQIYVKVDVTTIDFIIEPGQHEKDNGGNFLGFNRINKLSFCGALVYGDFDVPVFIVMYFDIDDELKVYIPEKGNLYNKFTLEAYNSESDPGLKYNWGDIQNDIHSKVITNEEEKVTLEFKKPQNKEKTVERLTLSELKNALQEALEDEDYRKAAELKKEIDSREI